MSIKAINTFFGVYVKKYWKVYIPMIIFIIGWKGTTAYATILYKDFINHLSENPIPFHSLISLAFWILGVQIMNEICVRIPHYIETVKFPSIFQNIITDTYQKIQKYSTDFFQNRFIGSLVKQHSRVYRAFDEIQDKLLWDFLPTTVIIISSIVIMASVNIWFSIILLIWVILFAVINYRFARFVATKKDNIFNEEDSKFSGLIADTFMNFSNVTLFNKTKEEFLRVEHASMKRAKAEKNAWMVWLKQNSIQNCLMALMEFVFLLSVIHFLKQGKINTGEIIMMQALLINVFKDIWDVNRVFRTLSQSYSDAWEMVYILQNPQIVNDIPNAKNLKISKGEITIRKLNFSYHSKIPIFKNLSLNIKAGEKIALVSRSGEGKSTLIKLLLRLYEIPVQSIYIDEQDITQVTQEGLREKIGLVSQDPILFHRSLRDNIAYGGKHATQKEIIAAAKKAHCHEFISKLPKGYDTLVGERGVKLSGGERQRITIARAILKNAPILILDEATSSLDSESEMYIQKALRELMIGKTSIVIAHRLSTIMQMDRILVIENGKISEEGTHATLIKKKGSHYKELWDIQSKGFEEK